MAQIALTIASQAATSGMNNVLMQSVLNAGAALAGSAIDNALFGTEQRAYGARLENLHALASTEGASIPRLFGRMRVGGQCIWATNFRERQVTETQGGGKGGGGGGATTTSYLYSASFAIGLCEGVIDGIGRLWADGQPFDLQNVTYRVYKGDETQEPDPLIVSIEGGDYVPAYRGLAYIVFEDLELEEFGNRIPQINVEIIKSAGGSDKAESLIKAVDLIPASGEFVYSDQVIIQELGPGRVAPETIHSLHGKPDMLVALDQLGDELPGVGNVALVVTWFGDDLRCGNIEFRPGVELLSKTTSPETWLVNAVDRANAHLMSVDADGKAVYGGTPSDGCVVAAIQELKARGYVVTFYPFILMDVPTGNALTDPYGGVEQSAFPWRGRITCMPAAGQAGTADKTAAAATQVTSFFGSAVAADFSVNGEVVSWTGGADWGFRRFILHYAKLCVAAGGVDTFLIASEMRGLTQIRDNTGAYPAVAALITLLADVRAIVGASVNLSYAADWSEYFGHHPADGSGDVFFHLDPLWSDANTDFIGIDNYMPLSDWRDGAGHIDALSGWDSIYDRGYLQSNIEGGEGYDWYYASEAARDAQARTTITDGAYSEPWVFRYKDIKNWWLNAHHDRPSGVKNGSPTSWIAQSKPIWFTEIGCPSVDKGANQPNVFVDPKSSESAVPFYSRGNRDDLMQRRFIEASLTYFEVASGNNPTSSVYAAPMIDVNRVYIWAWDARPYPDFPNRLDVWSDGENWSLGHWITGRMGRGDLAAIVTEIAASADFIDLNVVNLNGVVNGYIINDVESVRASLEPLMLAFNFDAVESGAEIKFVHRGQDAAISLTEDDVVALDGNSSDWEATRGQETELPMMARFTFVDGDDDYGNLTVEAQRQAGLSKRVTTRAFNLSIDSGQASAIAQSWLMEQWRARERMSIALAPSMIAIEATDVVDLTLGGYSRDFLVVSTRDAGARPVELAGYDAALYTPNNGTSRASFMLAPVVYGPPEVVFLDGPILAATTDLHRPYVAAYSSPWPGAIQFWKSQSQSGFVLQQSLSQAAKIGVLAFDLYEGPAGRWDDGNELWVDLYDGTLSSKSDADILAGSNLAAVINGVGEIELVSFVDAELISPGHYKLTRLLRGQHGTEHAMQSPIAAGARFVLLSSAVVPLEVSLDELGLELNWRYGPEGTVITDPAYAASDRLAFLGKGLRPLSPVQVGSETNGTGDLLIHWIRRTRIGGDGWSLSEVPLSEDTEAYEIDILNGAVVLRTLTSKSEMVTYPSAQLVDDFGSVPSNINIVVYQMSASFGRGIGAGAQLQLAA